MPQLLKESEDAPALGPGLNRKNVRDQQPLERLLTLEGSLGSSAEKLLFGANPAGPPFALGTRASAVTSLQTQLHFFTRSFRRSGNNKLRGLRPIASQPQEWVTPIFSDSVNSIQGKREREKQLLCDHDSCAIVAVSDMNRARDFYSNVLGLELAGGGGGSGTDAPLVYESGSTRVT